MSLPYRTIAQSEAKDKELERKVIKNEIGFKGNIKKADVKNENGIYNPIEEGVYVNANNLDYLPSTTDKGYSVKFVKDDNGWEKELVDLQNNKKYALETSEYSNKGIVSSYSNLASGTFTYSQTFANMENVILAAFVKEPKIYNNQSDALYKIIHFKYTVATKLLELVIGKSTDAGTTYTPFIYSNNNAVDSVISAIGTQSGERYEVYFDIKYIEEYCTNNSLSIFNYYVTPYPTEGNIIFVNSKLDESQGQILEIATLTFVDGSNPQNINKLDKENFTFSFDIRTFTSPDNYFFLEFNDGNSRLRIYQETDASGASEITFSSRPKILTIMDEETDDKIYIPLAVKERSSHLTITKVKFSVINSEIHLFVDDAYVCNLTLNFPSFNYKNSIKTDVLKIIPASSYREDLVFENIKSERSLPIDFSKFSKDVNLEMKKTDIAEIEKLGGEVLRGTLDGNQAALKIPIPFSHLGGTIEFDIQPNIDINSTVVDSDTHNLFELFIPNSDRGRFKMFIQQYLNENGDIRAKYYDAHFKTLMRFDSSSNTRNLATNDKIKNYWNGCWSFGVKVKCDTSVTYNDGNTTDLNAQVSANMVDTKLHMEYDTALQTGLFRIFHETGNVTIYSYDFDETTTIETLYNNLANETFNGSGDVLKLEVKDENVVGGTLVKDLAMLDDVSMVRNQTYYISDGSINEYKVDSGATINDSYFVYIPFNSTTVKHNVKIVYNFLGKDGSTEITDVSSVDDLIDGTFTTGSFKIIVDGSIVADIPFQEAVNSGSLAYNKAKLKENVQAWLYLGCDSYSTNDFKGKISNFKHTQNTKIEEPIILALYGHAIEDTTDASGQVNWGSTTGGTYEFSVQRLAFMFNYLKERGYVNINAKQLNDYIHNGGTLPKKCFIFQIDDARLEHFRNEKFRKVYRKYNVCTVISVHYDDRLDRVVVGTSTDEFPTLEELHAAIRANEIDVVIHGYEHPRHRNMSYEQMKAYLPNITEGMRRMGIYTNTNLITHGDWFPHTINAFREIGVTTFFESGNINLPKSLLSHQSTTPQSRISVDAITIEDFKEHLKLIENSFN